MKDESDIKSMESSNKILNFSKREEFIISEVGFPETGLLRVVCGRFAGE
jgi:hypothetical protein